MHHQQQRMQYQQITMNPFKQQQQMVRKLLPFSSSPLDTPLPPLPFSLPGLYDAELPAAGINSWPVHSLASRRHAGTPFQSWWVSLLHLPLRFILDFLLILIHAFQRNSLLHT